MKAHKEWLHKNYGGCSKNLSFRYGSRMGWEAALEWIKKELYAARDGFEPDLGLHNLLKKELNAKT